MCDTAQRVVGPAVSISPTVVTIPSQGRVALIVVAMMLIAAVLLRHFDLKPR